MRQAIVHGVIKHKSGYGWKATFKTSEEANKYNEMLMFILRDDGYDVEKLIGYYDNEEKRYHD